MKHVQSCANKEDDEKRREKKGTSEKKRCNSTIQQIHGSIAAGGNLGTLLYVCVNRYTGPLVDASIMRLIDLLDRKERPNTLQVEKYVDNGSKEEKTVLLVHGRDLDVMCPRSPGRRVGSDLLT